MKTAEAVSVATPVQSATRAETLAAMTRTGPDTVAGRYLRRFWHPVLLAQELPVGRALPVQALGEELTVYRGESGEAHAVAHRCAHRGAQLSVGTVEGETIRCLYHGWRYDAAGACTQRPAEPPSASRATIRIRSYPLVEYLGLLFVFLGEGDPPARPHFPELERAGVLESSSYLRHCNYFQNLENGVDEAHLPFVHRQTLFDVLNYAVPEISARETPYGLVQTARRPDGRVNEAHCLMPNMLTFVYPASDDPAVQGWTRYLSWRVPVDDHTHKTFILEHFDVCPDSEAAFRGRRAQRREQIAALPARSEVASGILAGKARLQDYADRPDYLLLGDDVAQRAQGVVQDRSVERLGRSDAAVLLLRRIWARELAAMESRSEPTAWECRIPLSRTSES